jgi:hypothetical protein
MISVFGENRVGARIGPNGRWTGMSDSDPDALFDFVAGMAINPESPGREFRNRTRPKHGPDSIPSRFAFADRG